jgi:NAD(P)H-dependent FMN reductase
MKILIFAGSLRKDSYNKKMARISRHFLSGLKDVETEMIDLRDYPMPVYDGDCEVDLGVPDSVVKLGEKIAAADALVISTPEYNGSIPGILKNTIDWLSRIKPVPLSGKHLFLTATSPGALGGVRSLWHSRVPFEVLGVHVYPDMLGVPKAHEQVMSGEKLADAKLQATLENFLSRYVEFVGKTLTKSL